MPRNPPGSGKLIEIARERGEPLEKLIPRLLGELKKPHHVAVALGVYDNTIFYWLRRHGYRKNPETGEWSKVK